MTLMNRPLYLRRLATFAVAALIGASALGQAMAHHHGQSPAAKPPVFIASTAKPFAALTDDAMAVMDDGMKRAPMNGVAEHDFVTMMIPHHQGAIDMALAELRYGHNEQLRRIAQEIIVEQQQEIDAMHLALGSPPAGASVAAPPSPAAERTPAAPPRASHADPMH